MRISAGGVLLISRAKFIHRAYVNMCTAGLLAPSEGGFSRSEYVQINLCTLFLWGEYLRKYLTPQS